MAPLTGSGGPRRWTSVCGLFVGLLLLAPAASAQQAFHLRMVPVMDQHGFAEPVAAKVLLAPADWRATGGIHWKVGDDFTGCPADFVETRFALAGPDGALGFEILPERFWQWAPDELGQAAIQMSGCRVAPPADAQGALQSYVQAFRRGARVAGVQPAPEAARAVYEDTVRVLGAQMTQQAQTSSDAATALLAYSIGDRQFEEMVTVTVLRSRETSPFTTTDSFRTTAVAFRAPAGQIGTYAPLFATMAASLRENPVWEATIFRLYISFATGQILAAGDRAGIWREAMNEIGEMRVRSWHVQQESQSRVAGAISRTLRGVDAYLDPHTGQQVQLPTRYTNAWSNGSGDYMLSVDPGFDPNVAFRQQGWQRMRNLE